MAGVVSDVFEVKLGQNGDDSVGESKPTLKEARESANKFLKQIRESGASTRVYILLPDGYRLYPPFGI